MTYLNIGYFFEILWFYYFLIPNTFRYYFNKARRVVSSEVKCTIVASQVQISGEDMKKYVRTKAAPDTITIGHWDFN